jgi:hypothetical protein
MGIKGVLFVTVVMALPASCLSYGWREWGQTGKLAQSDWRSVVPMPGLCFATVSQLLASGFLILGFHSDAQSFAEPAPTHWIIFNWLSVLAWGVTLLTSALGKGRLRLPLFLWSLSIPLAAWFVIMMGYDY